MRQRVGITSWKYQTFFRAVAESASVSEECDDIFFSCSSWWRFSYHFNDDVIKGRKTNSDKMRDVSRFSFLFFSLMRWGRLSFTIPWYGEFSAVFYVLPINHHHKWQATCFDCLHVPFGFFFVDVFLYHLIIRQYEHMPRISRISSNSMHISSIVELT